MAKCAYGIEQAQANEKNCFGCHFLNSSDDCDWRESDGGNPLNGPSVGEPLNSLGDI